MVHPQALCESDQVGDRTRIWAFAHILLGARVGSDCNICDHVFIENDVVIGDRVTVKCGVQLWDGIRVEDDVFIGPNVTFTNDPFPRSKEHLRQYATTLVRAGASLGANATVLPGITIGINAMVGAGAVVTRSVPPHAIVVGNPARITGYTNTPAAAQVGRPIDIPSSSGDRWISSLRGVRWLEMPLVEDLRGYLSVGEVGDQLPFVPQRYFVVFNVPSSRIRGEHAHRECEQLLVCVHGSVRVMVDDGQHREEYGLDSPHKALYVPPMIWAAQFAYSSDAVLLVLGSHGYDPQDYVRDYDEFLALAEARSDKAGEKDKHSSF